MPSTVPLILADVRQEFEALVAYVSGPASAEASADSVERTVFRRLLALGAQLLHLFFLCRAVVRPAEPVTSPDGTPLPYHDHRPTTYFSVFGKITFRRHAFWAPGQAVVCPLDAALSLPDRCYSDLLREWAAYGATDAAFRETQTLLERILGQSVSVQALETTVREAAADVAAFDAPPLGAPISTMPILVIQADGKGVPMVRSATAPAAPLRRGKGQPPGIMKEAIVTGLYTVAPYVRTPDEVVTALLAPPGGTRPASPPRPAPQGKEVRASLAGKTAALTALAVRADQVTGGSAGPEQVALTDGAEPLQRAMQAAFPEATLVLDIIHATEHLWAAATIALGERHPDRLGWVRDSLHRLLTGEVALIVADIREVVGEPTLSAWQRNELVLAAGYFERNAPYLHYDDYLARGWPIGTGVVEGACGHLVKDRMEQAGMRWTVAGAQSVLDLRAVRLNGHWDAFWRFHRQQQHRRCYGSDAVTDPAEDQMLAPVA